MDSYTVVDQSAKRESDKDSVESPNGQGSAVDADHLMVTNQTLQQMLASSGALMSPLRFMQPTSSSSPVTADGAAALSLPWMMSPYQMMVFPQELSQSLLASNLTAATTQDGQVVLLPATAAADDTGQQVVASIKTERSATAGQTAATTNSHVAAILRRQKTDGQAGDAAASQNDHSVLAQYLAAQQQAAAAVDGTAQHQTTHTTAFPSRTRPSAQDAAKSDMPKPPKKPLTPYMSFSKLVRTDFCWRLFLFLVVCSLK